MRCMIEAVRFLHFSSLVLLWCAKEAWITAYDASSRGECKKRKIAVFNLARDDFLGRCNSEWNGKLSFNEPIWNPVSDVHFHGQTQRVYFFSQPVIYCRKTECLHLKMRQLLPDVWLIGFDIHISSPSLIDFVTFTDDGWENFRK